MSVPIVQPGHVLQLIPVQRQMLELSLQGYDTDEIAKKVSRSPRSVRRCLNEKVFSLLRERLNDSATVN